MKKVFTLSLALAICGLGFADTVKVLSCGIGIPGQQEPQLQGLGISPNGKYVCGSIETGVGIFIADMESDEVIYTIATGDEGGELRHIDNNGLAVGIYENGITYSFQTETVTELPIPEGYRSSLCEDITEDGSMIVGSLSGGNFETHAAYKIGDGEWQLLPTPTEEEICGLNVRYETSAAKQVSGDGKVIFGFLGSFTIPIVWVRNDAGEYEYNFFPAKYLKLTEDDIDNEERPLYGISAHYLDVSNNGRYLSMLGIILINNDAFNVPVVYDLEADELIVYAEPQEIDESLAGLYPTSIDNDGTFIGCIGTPYFRSVGSFIWKKGEPAAQLFTEVFPEFAKIFAESDSLGFNIPTCMSADGRYIMGYTYVSDDFYDQSSPAYYVTYVIDRDGVSGVETVSGEAGAVQPKAIFDINGVRHNELTKGVNVVLMSDGSVKKVIKK